MMSKMGVLEHPTSWRTAAPFSQWSLSSGFQYKGALDEGLGRGVFCFPPLLQPWDSKTSVCAL